MQLQFRQGIVKYEQLQAPPFLTFTVGSQNSVDLNVVDSNILVTFAHGDVNYLIEETRSIVGAWGTGAIGSTNGPIPSVPTYLFWDISLASGAVTRGWTTLQPQVGADEPTSPADDQHWFDTASTKMRVWRSTGGGYWQDVLRVFAGKVYGANITPYAKGSQVGISGGSYSAGNILLGANNAPLRQADGSILSTSSQLIVQQTMGQNVMFDTALTFREAAENIPALRAVKQTSNRKVVLARGSEIQGGGAIGITISTMAAGETGRIITTGHVQCDLFSFPASSVGSTIFLGPLGELWTVRPVAGLLQVLGTIADTDMINLNIQAAIRQR